MITEPNDRMTPAQFDALLQRLAETDHAYQAAVNEAQSQGSALVKHARARLGLSQRAFAQQLGIDFTSISKIETGTIPPSKPFLRKLTQMMDGGARRQTYTPDATSPLAKAD